MSNLFTRIKNTIVADLNEALDHKEKKNPIALLNQYLRESEQEAEKVRKLLERQYQLKEEFTREYNEAADLAQKRKKQAEIAAAAGEQELQAFAQQEYEHYEQRASRLQEMLKQANTQLLELERNYEDMKHKLKDMHLRRMELMGRENITRANHQMSKVLHNEEYSDQPYSRFNEIETYIDRLEHEVNTSYYRSTIDAKIAQLEKDMKKAE
ncbi:PspA/IM30 family protein [Cytobacillus gottheilii]|uniref:PspA/IM30 family protein n=1 Tax=Cytobacillus gottheilii TaxID=859144 RepID=A0ABX8FE11_9BACI|nr:PspA/IM30 family protein [Cytobacillus gottheilii]QVY62272.1 PspA/IM30 family protein [Cytobacillus gottheilii]